MRVLSISLRIVLLAVIFAILFMVSSSLTAVPGINEMFTPEQVKQSTAALPIVAFIYTVVLSYLALRSRWHGWRLAGALFLIYYGIYTFLSQIETIAFPAVGGKFPPGMIRGLFIGGLILGIPFCALAVWILGKARGPVDETPNTRLQMPVAQWAWKLVIASVLYPAIYFIFGYYVAWRTPGLPAFYGGADPGTFLGQLGNVAATTPWLFPFQLLRGLIWTGIGCLIVRMHKGPAWETVLATAAAFCILMAGALIFPNPVMPAFVARAHAIELVTSNFVWGGLLALLLLWRPSAAATAPAASPA